VIVDITRLGFEFRVQPSGCAYRIH